MPQERLPQERTHPPAASTPDYERSAWLDGHNSEIQVEGDPETAEAFADTLQFLQLATEYVQSGAMRQKTPKGVWWTIQAEDIEEALAHRNQWATWEALRRGQEGETAVVSEVTLANALALSYRRLQALEAVGGSERPEYPLFLHLHEKIREACLTEAQLAQVLPLDPHEPLPPISPFLTTPAWKLLYETQRGYNPDSQTHTVIYGEPGQARFGFEAIDPFRPHRPETEFERELHIFAHQEQAIAVYHEYMDMGYMVSAVNDYLDNCTLVERWELPEQEDDNGVYTREDGAAASHPDFLARQAFSPDLVPMYQLTEQQYQAVVNHLSNLTVAIIEHLQAQGQPEFAQQIAGHAHGVLLDYDEDMAEVVQRVGRAQTAEDLKQEPLVYTVLAQV